MIIIECQIAERSSQPFLPQFGPVAGFCFVLCGVRLWLLTERAEPDGAYGLPVLRLGTDDPEGHLPMVTRPTAPSLVKVVTSHTESAETLVARDHFLSRDRE